MPTNALTVEEVRALLKSLEPQETEFATVETTSAELTADGCKTVAALCRHFLAPQQPLTAGEFAGLVVAQLKKRQAAWERGFIELDGASAERCRVRSEILEIDAIHGVEFVAREHNITIVEAKKP